MFELIVGNQSKVSVTGLLNNKKKEPKKKSPLAEVHMNVQENKIHKHENLVPYSKSPLQSETVSSAASLGTVMSFEKMRINFDKDIPEIQVTEEDTFGIKNNIENVKNKMPMKSRSPSSRSPSTLSTVQDNYANFRSI